MSAPSDDPQPDPAQPIDTHPEASLGRVLRSAFSPLVSPLMQRVYVSFVGTLFAIVVALFGLFAVTSNTLDDLRNSRAITAKQAASVAFGTPERDVVAALGGAQRREAVETPDGRRACLRYGFEGGSVRDSWRLCFDSDGRLVSKTSDAAQ